MASYQRMESYEYREYGSQPQPYRNYSYSDDSSDFFGGKCQSQSQGQLYNTHDNYSSKISSGNYGNATLTSSDQSNAYRLENYGTRADTVVTKPGSMSGDPFFDLVPSSFPPGTDQKVVDCFNRIDKDRNGLLSDKELQSALSSYGQSFSFRTVHLLMYIFTGTNARTIGPREFVPLMTSLQSWRATFQRYDRNRNGSIDASELREALYSLGFSVSPLILNLMVAKFDKSGGKCSIQYDNFIECCLTIKGLTGKFKAKENSCSGTATFTYEEFLLSVLPFIIA